VDEMQSGRVRGIVRVREGGEEGTEFGLAVGAEAGGDAVEVGIVVAGVGDKLPYTLRHSGQNSGEGYLVEVAGRRDAQCAVRGADEAATELR